MAVDQDARSPERDAGSDPDTVEVSRDISTGRLVAGFAVALVAAFVLGVGLAVFGLEPPVLVLETGLQLGSLALGLAIAAHLGWLRRIGLGPPVAWNRLWLAWLPAAYLLLAVLPGFPSRTVGQVAAALALCVCVGVNEEVWHRGLILESLRWKGSTAAVLVSSAVFGLFHGVNVLSGQPASTTAVQVGVAAAWGLALGALRVRTGTIWPSIAVHAAWDFFLVLRSGDLTAPDGIGWRDAVASLLLFAPLALYGLVLARPSMVPGPDGVVPGRLPPPPSGWPHRPPPRPPRPVEPLGPWPARPPHAL